MSADLILNGVEVENDGFLLTIESLIARRGEVTCVMGASGSGKSTLLQAIAGFLPLRHGTIRVGEKEVTAAPPEKRQIVLLFQRASLFPHYTLFKNIEFPLRLQKVSKEDRNVRVNLWLKRLGIEALSARYPSQVSGGEAQRAAFARALIAGFPVVLLDEPFSALDVALKSSLRQQLRRLVQETGTSALLVSHDPEDAKEIAETLYVLEGGRITKSGKPREILST